MAKKAQPCQPHLKLAKVPLPAALEAGKAGKVTLASLLVPPLWLITNYCKT